MYNSNLETEQKNVTKSQPKPFKPGNVRKINQSGLSSQRSVKAIL